MNNRCFFSHDRKYRYSLHHEWEAAKPMAAFIGLNPSTADENQLDPTLRRIRGFAEKWGFGSFVMLNLFAFRATDPKDMKAADDPVGPDNDRNISELCSMSEIVIACWGTHGVFKKRNDSVIELLSSEDIEPKCLKITKGGHPSHPLYLKGDLEPIVMTRDKCHNLF